MKRKRFSEERIVGILREAEQGAVTVAELCKAHGVSEQSFYRWKKKSGSMETADVKRLRELEKADARLKRIVAERDLEIDAMKEVMAKNW